MRARGWGTVALVAGGAAVAQSFGRFSYSVLLPAVRDDLGISNTVAGLLGTANVGAYLIGTLLIVRATTRLALLTIFRTGLVLSVTGLSLASLAPTGNVLAAALVLMGIGGACIWIPSPALATEAIPVGQRGLGLGVVSAGIGLGIVFAGRATETLRARSGDGAWNDVYAIEAGLGLAVLVAIFVLLRPDTSTAHLAATRSVSSLKTLRTMHGWVALVSSYAAFGFSYLLALTFLTARLEDDAGYSQARAAAAFAVLGLASIGGGILLGALADRVGPRRALIVGFAVFTAGPLAVLTSNVAGVFVGSAAIGMMFGGLPTVIAAYVVQASDLTTYGPRYAVATLAFGIAQATSPQVGGFLADLTGSFTIVFALSSAVALVGVVAAAQLPRPDRAPGLDRGGQ